MSSRDDEDSDETEGEEEVGVEGAPSREQINAAEILLHDLPDAIWDWINMLEADSSDPCKKDVKQFSLGLFDLVKSNNAEAHVGGICLSIPETILEKDASVLKAGMMRIVKLAKFGYYVTDVLAAEITTALVDVQTACTKDFEGEDPVFTSDVDRLVNRFLPDQETVYDGFRTYVAALVKDYGQTFIAPRCVDWEEEDENTKKRKRDGGEEQEEEEEESDEDETDSDEATDSDEGGDSDDDSDESEGLDDGEGRDGGEGGGEDEEGEEEEEESEA